MRIRTLFWLLLALYFVIAAIGKGAGLFALAAFIAGVQAQRYYEKNK